MADLIDRLSGESRQLDPPRPKIETHQFMGAFRGYVSGIVTASEITTAYDLQGDELSQATSLKNNIDAAGSALNKISYVLQTEAVAFLIEDGSDTMYHTAGAVNKTRVKADLGW
jgi:hypothetical protein